MFHCCMMPGNSLQNWAVCPTLLPPGRRRFHYTCLSQGGSWVLLQITKFIITKFIIKYNNESTESSHPNLSFLSADQIVKRIAPLNDEKSVPKGPFQVVTPAAQYSYIVYSLIEPFPIDYLLIDQQRDAIIVD